MQDYHEFLDEILIDAITLQKRIADLGADISRDYQGQDLHLICILRGGVLFLTDLMRQIKVPHTIDFRSVYAAILARTLGCDARSILGQRFEPLDVVRGA